MDEQRFDAIARHFGNERLPRRGLLTIAASALPLLFGLEARHCVAKKKKRKKKKKRSGQQALSPPAPPAQLPPSTPPPPGGCSPNCANKACGAPNGCGGTCQTGSCPGGDTCQNGQCVSSTCTPACSGNHLCQNGSCVCPPGLKECEGSGFHGNCHACCPDPFQGGGDTDCEAHVNGPYCGDLDGDLVLACGCFSAATTCPNGECGICCSRSDCAEDLDGDGFKEDTGRDCVSNGTTGELTCKCDPGLRQCPNFSLCTLPKNPSACGPNCRDCNHNQPYDNYICEGNPERCCLPLDSLCALDSGSCCPPFSCQLNARGTNLVCR